MDKFKIEDKIKYVGQSYTLRKHKCGYGQIAHKKKPDETYGVLFEGFSGLFSVFEDELELRK